MQAVRLSKLFLGQSGLPAVMTSMLRSEQPQLATSYLSMGGVRHKIQRPRFNYKPRTPIEGEQVIECFGFNYYPRHPGHVDPPYEPTKLFAVRRVRTLIKRPYWERRIVAGELGLGSRRTVAIVKNTPQQNQTLYQVKHLIEITPITSPNGMPSDPTNAFLKENGEFIAYDKLAPSGAESLDQIQEDVEALRRRDLGGDMLKKRLSLQWYSRW